MEGRESERLSAWLHREDYTESHRLGWLPNYKAPQQVVEVLTEAEIGRLLKACDPKTAWGARAHAIVTLALDSGLRLSEITGLRSADLNLEAGWLKVSERAGRNVSCPSAPRASGHCGDMHTTTGRSRWELMSTSS